MINTIELGGIINGSFKRYIFTTIDKVEETINEKKFDGDIYKTIYRYENKNTDSCNFIAPLYLDFDIDNIEENFMKIKLDLILAIRQLTILFSISEDDIQLFFSGSKGFHIIIDEKIFGFEPGRELNKQLKIVALKIKSFTVNKSVDTKIYDYKRLFRVENTINSKTGLYKVPLRIETLKSMNSYNEIKEYAKEKKCLENNKVYEFNEQAKEGFEKIILEHKEENKRHINTRISKEFIKKKKMLPCVEYILQNGARPGSRNNTTVALAAALFQIEEDFETVLDIIKSWNSNKNEEPLSDREVMTTVESAYRMTMSGRFYGCSAFMDLDLCVKNCPIYKD